MTRRQVPVETLRAHGLPVAADLTTGSVAGQVSGVSVDGCPALCVVAAYGCALDGPAGTAPSDRYELDRDTLEPIRRELGRKARAYARDPLSGGVVLRDVPAAQQDRSALDFAQLVAIGELALQAERALGAQIVLRWVIDAGGALSVVAACHL